MIASLLAAVCVAFSPCSTAKQSYAFQRIVVGLEKPTYVTTAPGVPGTLYVVEQAGRIRTVEGSRITGTFLDITSKVVLSDVQGLLSMAFSPRYATNHRFYVYYTDLQNAMNVVEYRSDGTTAIPSTARRLLLIPHPGGTAEDGGQLQFDRQGLLYAATGSLDTRTKTAADPAQSLSVRAGKLLRIDPLTPGAKWRIVGYGFRNLWRFSFDRLTGDLWMGDVGRSKYEEIDFRPRPKIGQLANYGWPRYEGNAPLFLEVPLLRSGELVFPAWTYPHRDKACSVTGGYVYRGSTVPAAVGRYFFGDWCTGVVWSFKVGSRGLASAPRTEPFAIPQVTSFGEDARGELYATSLDGGLYKLTG